MDRFSFEKLVGKALERLPAVFKEKMENIAIQIEDRPSIDTLRDMDIQSGTLLGLYQGVPLTERGWGYGNVLPDRIIIYQRTIEDTAKSLSDIEDIVLDVVIHEIGHYFGFSDSELYEIADNKRRKKRMRKRS